MNGHRGTALELHVTQPPGPVRSAGKPSPLPAAEPCRGCGQPRHPLVRRVPSPISDAIRWAPTITGSRPRAAHSDLVLAAVRSGLLELREQARGWPTRVLHGDPPGIDRLHPAHRPVWPPTGDWDRQGRRAGVLRDLSLIARADTLLAIWDRASADTRPTLDLAAKRELLVVYRMLAQRSTGPPGPAEQCGGVSLHRDARVWRSFCVQHTDSSSGAMGCSAGGGR